MKQLVTWSPVFNPTLKTLDFSGISNFEINKLYAVINVTRSTPLYVPGTTTFGAAISGNSATAITLTCDTSTHAPSDILNIYYDTSAGYESNAPMETGGNLQSMQEILSQILVELKLQSFLLIELGAYRMNSIKYDELQEIRDDINNPVNSITTST